MAFAGQTRAQYPHPSQFNDLTMYLLLITGMALKWQTSAHFPHLSHLS